MIRTTLLASLSAAALAATPAFAAAGAGKEISTAIEHSGYASQVKSAKKVHLHLHHVVNCLVGPNGEGFYPAAGNPCQGEGNGALNDLSGQAKVRSELKDALSEAKKGLGENRLKAARKTAEKVHTALQTAQADYSK